MIIYGWRTPFSDKNPLIDGSEVSIMANYGESLAADGLNQPHLCW